MAIHYNTETQQYEFYTMVKYTYTDQELQDYALIVTDLNTNRIKLKVYK